MVDKPKIERRGGARPGAGRKKKGVVAKSKKDDPYFKSPVGGPRPNSGRKTLATPAGFAVTTSKITEHPSDSIVKHAVKKSKPTTKITPLDVLIGRMMELWDDGNASAANKDKACRYAKDAAPYVHAKLTSVEAKVTHSDLREMSTAEIKAELNRLREKYKPDETRVQH